MTLQLPFRIRPSTIDSCCRLFWVPHSECRLCQRSLFVSVPAFYFQKGEGYCNRRIKHQHALIGQSWAGFQECDLRCWRRMLRIVCRWVTEEGWLLAEGFLLAAWVLSWTPPRRLLLQRCCVQSQTSIIIDAVNTLPGWRLPWIQLIDSSPWTDNRRLIHRRIACVPHCSLKAAFGVWGLSEIIMFRGSNVLPVGKYSCIQQGLFLDVLSQVPLFSLLKAADFTTRNKPRGL